MVGGWSGRLPARGWDKGSRIGVVAFGGRGVSPAKTHFWKLTQPLKNHCVIIDVV
jgi:hypothetical protein